MSRSALFLVKNTGKLWTLCFLIVLTLAISFRAKDLDRIPGINGDEAFPTVQMRELTSGRPVTLWVPTQRILSPIYAGWVLMIQKLRPQVDLWTVRAPALFAGILLLVFSFFLTQKTLGRSQALVVTLILASSPMAIAYSRSAVEQCLMGIVGLFPLVFALQGKRAATLLGYFVAVLAHPVNVFLAPLLVFPLMTFAKPRSYFVLAGSFLLVALGLVLALPAEYGVLNLASVFHFFTSDPIAAFQAFNRFLLAFVRILNGVTVYEYFASPIADPMQWILDGVGIATLSLVFFLGIRGLKKENKKKELALVVGFLASLLLLFIVAGPRALSAGLSRHANFLPVPFALTFTLLLAQIFQKRLQALLWGVLTAALVLLFQFQSFYFSSIKKDGGGFTHRTYATGPVEPKAAVFSWILTDSDQDRREGKKIQIIAEDWWIYWPVHYLALPHPEIEVIHLDSTVSRAQFQTWFENGAYALGFENTKVAEQLYSVYGAEKAKGLVIYQPPSYSSEIVLSVWRLTPQAKASR